MPVPHACPDFRRYPTTKFPSQVRDDDPRCGEAQPPAKEEQKKESEVGGLAGGGRTVTGRSGAPAHSPGTPSNETTHTTIELIGEEAEAMGHAVERMEDLNTRSYHRGRCWS